MIQIIVTLLLLFVALKLNQWFIVPSKILNKYQKGFKQRGYKVYVFPKSTFLMGLFQKVKKDQQMGDSFKSIKQQYSAFDLIMGSMHGKPWILLNHPNLIKSFCMAQKQYKLLKPQRAKKRFKNITQGILFSEKAEWKKKKKILSNVFNFTFLTKLTPRIDLIFKQQLIETQKQGKKQNQREFTYDFLNFSEAATSETILRCFLGLKSQKHTIDNQKPSRFLIDLIEDFMQSLLDPLSMILNNKIIQMGFRSKDRELNRRVNVLNSWSSEYIQNRISQFDKNKKQKLQSKGPEDIIEAILLENQKLTEQERYTKEEIIDEFKLFFLAGTDTTTHYIVMLLYYIAKHSEVNEKLRKQIKQFLQKNNQITTDNLKQLPYMQAVLKQTTRVYGPANFLFLRQAVDDFYFQGIPIYKGTYVRHFSMSLHYSQQYYKNPSEFRPQRWLNGQCDNLDPYALIGFSCGTRSCIGKHLALIESKIAIIRFLQRYKQVKVPQQPLKMQFKFVYGPQRFESTMTLADEILIQKF